MSHWIIIEKSGTRFRKNLPHHDLPESGGGAFEQTLPKALVNFDPVNINNVSGEPLPLIDTAPKELQTQVAELFPDED